MKRTIGKRLAHLAVVILGVSFLTFLLMYIAPGDPAQKKLTAQGVAVSQEVLEATRQEMGLDRPFLARYGDWLWSALRGDLGVSYKDGLPVSGKLAGPSSARKVWGVGMRQPSAVSSAVTPWRRRASSVMST